MLSEIRELFSCFERSSAHHERVKSFRNALDKIKEFMMSSPDKEEIEITNNLKLAYTRKLLEQISPESEIPFPEEYWIDYAKILLIECKPEVEEIVAKNSQLLRNLNLFKESIKGDLQEFVRML